MYVHMFECVNDKEWKRKGIEICFGVYTKRGDNGKKNPHYE